MKKGKCMRNKMISPRRSSPLHSHSHSRTTHTHTHTHTHIIIIIIIVIVIVITLQATQSTQAHKMKNMGKPMGRMRKKHTFQSSPQQSATCSKKKKLKNREHQTIPKKQEHTKKKTQ
ncbi:hypothetical protein, unlikely [Trypanosoma brucei gambiense DAL972]|uniref:Uncharacterized protein n=1 Tax=Trypanosoma brucei gambiense (strain MHOM/CI/86/DAL972) TaxID=679716 RepID=C9ZNW5_TRYB9|nr:hypothetical protein, unlikely [Trypanosoma brucei gambiense DAL972]CBH11093.1 hypothetical protein, unlikely [Trypanosoma brucei gambiense DAL972]|eukprot:XP_011773380.1 hypothetical protein, unlikely [Trypanosoma brucei gambiense DAL972]